MGANICEKDCWKCELEGCPYTLRSSLDLDQELQEAKTDTSRQLSIKRYNDSYKRKIVQRRYRASEKGRKTNRENTQRYYQRHREEYLARQRERYAQNKDYYREKRRKQYLKWKKKNMLNDYENRMAFNNKVRYSKAKSAWVNRFKRRINRMPTEDELLEWEIKYWEKRERKESMANAV